MNFECKILLLFSGTVDQTCRNGTTTLPVVRGSLGRNYQGGSLGIDLSANFF